MPDNFDKEFDELNQSLAVIEICKDLLEHKKRDTKILFIALLVSLCINAFTIGAFLWYESTWDYDSSTITTRTEQTVDGDGNIVNGDQYNDQSQNNSGGDE